MSLASTGQSADAPAGQAARDPAAHERVAAQPGTAGQAARDPAAPERVAAQPGTAGQVRRRLGDVAGDLARRARAGADQAIALAANRAISPNSVTGISLLLGLCAAVWFSGGTRQDDMAGLITTGAWVVVRAAARQLAAVTARRTGRGRPRQPDHSDWMVLAGLRWSAEEPPEQADVERRRIERAREREFGWFYAVCATAGESAIYGGIAAGAQEAGWTATWPLAVAIVIVASIASIARACGTAAAQARLDGRKTTGGGVRVLAATLIMAGYGPRIALVAMLAAGVVSLVHALVAAGGLMAASRRAATSAAWDVVLACRDDGPFARRAGWLVRGNLMPVPPAVAGLVAIGLLTALGIKHLPGIVALTPVVVLLLAAPGSSHPHDGRYDWLVPVLLCVAQYCYLVALGAAKSVSWPLVFAACSMTAVWYASLVASRARAAPAPARTRSSRRTRVNQIMARRTEGIGWEGRVGLVGLAGMFGIATFGYLGLTACLAVLICRKMAIDYLGEDRRQ